MSIAWQFHALWLASYLGVGLILSAFNGWLGTKGAYPLRFREGFGIAVVIWLPSMAAFYAVLAVLLESGALT